MKKISYAFVGLALLAACVFKVGTEYKLFDKPSTYVRPAPTLAPVKSPADDTANGICRGALTLEVFGAAMYITQDDIDGYNARYADEGKTCDALRYLGSVQNEDGSTDEIYTMTISKKNLWYVITVFEGLTQNIQ